MNKKKDKRKWWQTSLLYGPDGELSESSVMMTIVFIFDAAYLIFDLLGRNKLTWECITVLGILTLIAYINKEGSRKSWSKWWDSINNLNVSSSGISLTRDTDDDDENENK